MTPLFQLVEAGPRLVGAVDHERWSELYYLNVLKKEIEDKNSVFAAKPGEAVARRLEILGGLYMADGADEDKVWYWICLLNLMAAAYGKSRGEDRQNEIDELVTLLTPNEPSHPEFAAIVTVQAAAVTGQWA
jgi:hypothetical protein